MMTVGYLYFDDSKLSLPEKVAGAVEYHVKKVGFVPDLCLVHHGDFEKGEFLVTTRPFRSIPKNHLWVGMEENEKKS